MPQRRPALSTNHVFRQPSGSDEGADAILLRESQVRLRVGSIRSPAALPRMAVRGRAFLSEQPNDNGFGYDKGGQRRALARRAHQRAVLVYWRMPNYRRAHVPGGTFCFTVVLAD